MTRMRRIVVASAMVGAFGLLAAAGADPLPAQDSTTTTPTTVAGAGIVGTLRVDDRPVPGVRVTASRAGAEVGTATSDAQGAWRIAVPERGAYRVALDTTTLPEGVRAARAELPEFRVRANRQPALFQLSFGKRTGPGGPSRFGRLLDLFVGGIRFGLIVGLCSVGLSLIYGTTGLVNFAHGELVTFGALIAFLCNTMVSGPKWPLVAAAIVGMAATGLLGALTELAIWRPMTRRRTGAVARMLVSIGLALFLRYLYQVIFEGNPRAFRQYSAQAPFEIGPVSLPPREYVVIVVCFVMLILVGTVLQRTRLGTAVRAVSDERDLASASGIDVQRVVLLVWIGGGMLAGLGGVMLAVSQSVQWNLGFRLLLTMFAAVVLGGLGNPYGAMAGGLAVGVTSQVSTYWLPADFQFAVALAILILVLLVRPQGLLGVRERIG
jgi:neutral amino acid transport system permease protein